MKLKIGFSGVLSCCLWNRLSSCDDSTTESAVWRSQMWTTPRSEKVAASCLSPMRRARTRLTAPPCGMPAQFNSGKSSSSSSSSSSDSESCEVYQKCKHTQTKLDINNQKNNPQKSKTCKSI